MPVTFRDLGLRTEIWTTLTFLGYETPTPIQEQAIPAAMEGRDVLGLAQTGTGKTAAFLLPILHKIAGEGRPTKPHCPKALILAPTRELALQIAASFRDYSKGLHLRYATIVGGVSQQRQAEDLKRGVDVVIATPGRLIDLLEQRLISLCNIETLVMDEADRMLEIGFLPSIQRIVSVIPANHQTLFFSATMPRAVAGLAQQMLRDPVRVEVVPESTPVERIEQSVIIVPAPQKRQALLDLMADDSLSRVIIFTKTKHGADKVARLLDKVGISTGAMHGRKSQGQRQSVLKSFSMGKIRALVATDVAARGIDVDNVTHVINYELPMDPESYVHRIGRTARAGKSGVAIALCDYAEKSQLRAIERLMRCTITIANRPPQSHLIAPSVQSLATPEEMAEDRSSYKRGKEQKSNSSKNTRPERKKARPAATPDEFGDVVSDNDNTARAMPTERKRKTFVPRGSASARGKNGKQSSAQRTFSPRKKREANRT